MWKRNSQPLVETRQVELRRFRDVALAQLDHAASEPSNDGPLWLELNDVNLTACKWDAVLPAFSDDVAATLPFAPGETVTIHVRYRYGRSLALINLWLIDPNDASRSWALGLSVNPRTSLVREDSNMNNMGSDHNREREIRATEVNTRQVLDAIFAGNTDYAAAARLGIVDALHAGIMSQSDSLGELYTAEEAGKDFPAGGVMNGYQLRVRVIDRTHPKGKPSKLFVTLWRAFRSTDYKPHGIYSGHLEQKILLVSTPDGVITEATRSSEIHLNNELAITEMSITPAGQPAGQPRQMVVTMGNQVKNRDIPRGLRGKGYPDDRLTLDDLAYFERLITQPLVEADMLI